MLPSATIAIPDPITPDPTLLGPTSPNRSRPFLLPCESSREGLRPQCCRLQLSSRPAGTHPAMSRPNEPDLVLPCPLPCESSREHRSAPCCCLQLLPGRSKSCHAKACRTAPSHVYSLKRAAGSLLRSSVLPSATVTTPCTGPPSHTTPNRVLPY